MAQGSMSGGKLPIHIYESVLQPGTAAEATDADADAMQVEEEAAPTQPADGAVATKLRFRRTPYTVETGEAEMIAMDFVAKGGGGNASIGELKPKPVDAQAPHDAKGKRRKAETEAVVDGQQDAPEPATVVLTPAEEERE